MNISLYFPISLPSGSNDKITLTRDNRDKERNCKIVIVEDDKMRNNGQNEMARRAINWQRWEVIIAKEGTTK